MSEIQDKVAKQFLVKAKDFLEKEDYKKTIAYATTALEVILKKATQGDVSSLRYQQVGLYEITICSYLGIDIQKYVRYRKMAGYWEAIETSEEVREQKPTAPNLFSKFSKVHNHNFNRRDAEVSLEYCTETIKDIEKTLEQLSKFLSEE